MDVAGSRVLITGASRGIGASMARAFVEAGATVALAARTEDAITDLAAELGGKAYPLDVSDPGQLDGFIAKVEADGGPVDILCNNAGVETLDLLEDLDEAEISRVVMINLIAPQRLTRQALPGMIERGRGHLVYSSSVATFTPSPGLAVYCATKAGLTRFGETVRIEVKKTGIGVTTLHLGPVDTSMWERVTGSGVFDAAQKRFRRLGLLVNVSPEKVAADTVVAVEKGKREVRHPKRLSSNMALNSAPARLTEGLLVGFVPRKHRGR